MSVDDKPPYRRTIVPPFRPDANTAAVEIAIYLARLHPGVRFAYCDNAVGMWADDHWMPIIERTIHPSIPWVRTAAFEVLVNGQRVARQWTELKPPFNLLKASCPPNHPPSSNSSSTYSGRPFDSMASPSRRETPA